jgi:DNA-directed RNA polymerase specialized sigma24 family protein
MLGSCKKGVLKNYGEGRRYATPSEVRCYFREHQEFLFWITFGITGREDVARSSFVAACENAARRRNVFFNWVGKWAQFAAAQSAITAIQEDIAKAAEIYAGQFSEHFEHPGLSEAEIRILRAADPRQMFTDLDPLARSVLILQTLRNTTLYDCAVALDVPRAIAAAAYGRALVWLRAQKNPGPGATAPPNGLAECHALLPEFVRQDPQKKAVFR